MRMKGGLRWQEGWELLGSFARMRMALKMRCQATSKVRVGEHAL